MKFDGSVKASSFEAVQVKLMSAQQGTGIESYTFKKGVTKCTSNDGFEMVLSIGRDDLDAIKKLRNLAIADKSTFLSFTAQAFDDVFGQSIKAIVPNSALKVKTYTADTKAPTVTGFQVAVDPGNIVLSFSEMVDIKTL